MLLQQQYRERCFVKYYELITCLFVAEQNNELLLKNHQPHPTRSMTLLEANVISVSNHRRGRGHGHYYGRGRGRGHGCHNSWNRDSHGPPQNKKNGQNNQKLNYLERSSSKATLPHSKQAYEINYYRCRMKGH